ncbi:MAG: GNAT family N-acetyltransferase, partial [Propionibacterium sp. 4572_24]
MMSCPTRGNGADASGAGLHQGDVDLHYAHTIDMD